MKLFGFVAVMFTLSAVTVMNWFCSAATGPL
jgi:hypothetical protein